MEMSQARRDMILKAIQDYSSMVYRLAYARTRNHADAEDIYQEVFIKMAECETTFDSEEKMKAWLLRVTVNCSVNLFRSAWRRYVHTVEIIPEASERIESDERYEALNRALDNLPACYRTVIHLFYYEEMTVDEISSILNTKPATIRSRLSRGRIKLKAVLEKNKEANLDV